MKTIALWGVAGLVLATTFVVILSMTIGFEVEEVEWQSSIEAQHGTP